MLGLGIGIRFKARKIKTKERNKLDFRSEEILKTNNRIIGVNKKRKNVTINDGVGKDTMQF